MQALRKVDRREGFTYRVVERTGILPDSEWSTEQIRADQLEHAEIGPILHLKGNGENRQDWSQISNKSLTF